MPSSTSRSKSRVGRGLSTRSTRSPSRSIFATSFGLCAARRRVVPSSCAAWGCEHLPHAALDCGVPAGGGRGHRGRKTHPRRRGVGRLVGGCGGRLAGAFPPLRREKRGAFAPRPRASAAIRRCSFFRGRSACRAGEKSSPPLRGCPSCILCSSAPRGASRPRRAFPRSTRSAAALFGMTARAVARFSAGESEAAAKECKNDLLPAACSLHDKIGEAFESGVFAFAAYSGHDGLGQHRLRAVWGARGARQSA